MASAPTPSASPGLAARGCRPLRAWRTSRLQSIGQRLGDAAHDWSLAWGLPVAAAPGAIEPGPTLTHDGPWQAFTGSDGDVLGWLRAAGPAHPGGRLGWGAECGPIARRVEQRCATDGAARLAAALSLVPSTAPSPGPGVEQLARWSGAVLFDGIGGADGFTLVLAAAAVQALGAAAGQDIPLPSPSSLPALVGLDQALYGRRLVLRVHLQGCDLDLGLLAGLRIGDVVRLDHALDVPATLSAADGLPCFAAHLAQRGGRKAVVLAPLKQAEAMP